MKKRGVVAGVAGVALLSAAALRGVLRRFAIREESMQPALLPGDWVVARRRTGALDRGDIVVFNDPNNPGTNLVKRVIGLPGELVGVSDGRVTIDGALLADRWATGMTRPDGEWAVPEGHVWLLGDNRAASASDGRQLGPTPVADTHWVVTARYWPTTRVGAIGD